MTRTFTLSARKIANEGPRYWGQFLGTPVVHTDYEGTERVGVIENFEHGYPIVRFPDGKWARLDLRITVTDEAGRQNITAEPIVRQFGEGSGVVGYRPVYA